MILLGWICAEVVDKKPFRHELMHKNSHDWRTLTSLLNRTHSVGETGKNNVFTKTAINDVILKHT